MSWAVRCIFNCVNMFHTNKVSSKEMQMFILCRIYQCCTNVSMLFWSECCFKVTVQLVRKSPACVKKKGKFCTMNEINDVNVVLKSIYHFFLKKNANFHSLQNLLRFNQLNSTYSWVIKTIKICLKSVWLEHFRKHAT